MKNHRASIRPQAALATLSPMAPMLAVVLALAACGGGGSTSAPSSTDTSSPDTTTPTTPVTPTPPVAAVVHHVQPAATDTLGVAPVVTMRVKSSQRAMLLVKVDDSTTAPTGLYSIVSPSSDQVDFRVGPGLVLPHAGGTVTLVAEPNYNQTPVTIDELAIGNFVVQPMVTLQPGDTLRITLPAATAAQPTTLPTRERAAVTRLAWDYAAVALALNPLLNCAPVKQVLDGLPSDISLPATPPFVALANLQPEPLTRHALDLPACAAFAAATDWVGATTFNGSLTLASASHFVLSVNHGITGTTNQFDTLVLQPTALQLTTASMAPEGPGALDLSLDGTLRTMRITSATRGGSSNDTAIDLRDGLRITDRTIGRSATSQSGQLRWVNIGSAVSVKQVWIDSLRFTVDGHSYDVTGGITNALQPGGDLIFDPMLSLTVTEGNSIVGTVEAGATPSTPVIVIDGVRTPI